MLLLLLLLCGLFNAFCIALDVYGEERKNEEETKEEKCYMNEINISFLFTSEIGDRK